MGGMIAAPHLVFINFNVKYRMSKSVQATFGIFLIRCAEVVEV